MRRSCAGLALIGLLAHGCDAPASDDPAAERDLEPALPAELILDPEQPVEGPVIGGVGTESGVVQVAWSGTRYLAAWHQGGPDGVSGTYFTRIAADGSLLDAPSVRLTQGGSPAVAFFGGFLVALDAGPTIELWRVGQQGAISLIDDVGPNDRVKLPDIAAGTDEAIIVFSDGSDQEPARIHSARYDGTALSPVVELGNADEPAGPHIAYRPGGQYLVVWENAVGNVRGRFVSPANVPGLAFPISSANEQEEEPAVAFAGSSFVVVWRAVLADGVQIRAALVSPTGQVGAPVDVSSVMAAADRPSVSCDIACTVLWTGGSGPTTSQLWGRRLGGDLSPLGDQAIVVGGPGPQGPGELAGTGSARYLVWLDSQSGRVDAYGSTASIDGDGGLALGGPTLLPLGDVQRFWPAVAASSTQWLVAWHDTRNGGFDFFGRRFDLDGMPRTARARPIHERARIQRLLAVAGSESGFLAAWAHDESWTTGELRATRIGPGGAALDPAGITLGTEGWVRDRIQVAAGGDTGWLVAWERTDQAWHVHAAVVRPDGSTSAPLDLDGRAPAIAFDPVAGVYLLLWEDLVQNGGTIKGLRVAPDGTPVDADPVVVSTEASSDIEVAYGAGLFFVTFSTGNVLRGMRVALGPGGIEVLDPASFPLDPTPGVQEHHAVTFTARSFLVAYEWRELGDDTTDIRGVQVSPDGTVQGSALVLADGPDAETSPAFAGASQRRALLAFDRVSDDASTLLVRRLVIGFPDGATCTDDAQCESGSCVDGFCCGPFACP